MLCSPISILLFSVFLILIEWPGHMATCLQTVFPIVPCSQWLYVGQWGNAKTTCNFWITSLEIKLLSQCIPSSLILGQEQQLAWFLDLKMEATCWRWCSQLTSQSSWGPHTYHKGNLLLYNSSPCILKFLCNKSLTYTLANKEFGVIVVCCPKKTYVASS